MTDLRARVDAFWPVFLSTHLHPWNRRFHVLGNIVLFGAFLAFAFSGWWPWVAIAFAGYAPSWIGHFVFERNLPVTLRAPLISALCDLKMIGYLCAGELEGELERLFGSPAPVPGTPILVTTQDEIAYQESLRLHVGSAVGEHPFTRYWDVFVLKHQRGVNVWIHVIAMVYLYALCALAVATRRYELLLLVPLSQIAGLVSHARFERSHIDSSDALFSRRAFASLNKMMWLVLTGRYGRELARVREELRQWRASRGRVNGESPSTGARFSPTDTRAQERWPGPA